jgi:type IV secretory pathway VirB10-like protein
MDKKIKTDYDWYIQADLSRYQGKYVAIAGRKVVAAGYNAKQVYENALKKSPKIPPTLAKIPAWDVMVLTVVLGNDCFQISSRER